MKCVCVAMCSLVMNLFSLYYIKTELDYLKYQQCLTCLRTCVQYSHSAWILDCKTSILVYQRIPLIIFHGYIYYWLNSFLYQLCSIPDI